MFHSDRGRQFISVEFNEFCHSSDIVHSVTTPYHPQGNGQCERTNETLWNAMKCILHPRGLLPDKWESVMGQALASMRCLMSTATNESPHQRFFAFDRRSSVGFSTPKWMEPGKIVYLKQYVSPKKDHP